jgi:hypothetical protein
MSKTFRPYVPEQDLLLPPSVKDWQPDDHLAYFVCCDWRVRPARWQIKHRRGFRQPSVHASSKLVKHATLKIYQGGSHGLADTNKDQLNTDLLAFLER